MADWTALYYARQGLRERESAPARLAAERLQSLYPDNVDLVNGDTDTAYPEAVAVRWHRPGKLIIIEQDIEVSPEHLSILLACPALACAWQYHIYPASSGKLTVYPTVREEWETYAPIGLCCLSESVRAGGNFPSVREWGRVEHALQLAVQGTARKWHVHFPPVNHHHGMIQKNRDTVLVPDGLVIRYE